MLGIVSWCQRYDATLYIRRSRPYRRSLPFSQVMRDHQLASVVNIGTGVWVTCDANVIKRDPKYRSCLQRNSLQTFPNGRVPQIRSFSYAQQNY